MKTNILLMKLLCKTLGTSVELCVIKTLHRDPQRKHRGTQRRAYMKIP